MSVLGTDALSALRFNYTETADDVWRHSAFHVDAIHAGSARILLDCLAEAAGERDGSPIGVVLQGQRGTGKTHLLGWVRDQVQRRGGYFFLIGLLDGRQFWDGLLHFLMDGLARQVSAGDTQLRLLLRRLPLDCEVATLSNPGTVAAAIRAEVQQRLGS